MPTQRLGALAVLVTLTGVVFGQTEKLAKVEIGKRGKAATAYVDVPERGSGTAFCIHPSGLFVTNEHVVRGAAEAIVVLNPSLGTEKVVKAKVVRVDKDADLALLRVDGIKDLPSLPLGSADEVDELAEVVACGFPLGKALATDKKEYPAVSVAAGSVTSLRRRNRELQYIQVDVAVTYGSSGGPVLDDKGRVVGVVKGGVDGGKVGLNMAIPVNTVNKFLKAPDFAFTPPNVSPADADKPREFKARVVSPLPGAPEPKVKLVLRADDETPREFPMKNVSGEWVATAAPLAKTAGKTLGLTVRFADGSIEGRTDDAEFTVGGAQVKLSGVRAIEFGPKPVVTLTSGKTLTGEIAGLAATTIRLGDEVVQVRLPKAAQVTVRTDNGPLSVLATVIATVDDKEIGRYETRFGIGQVSIGGGGPTVAIKPPAMSNDKVEKLLSEVFDEAVLAGGGKYLVFRFTKLKKLGVFDVSEGKVTNYIPLAEDKAVFAGGLDAIIVGLPSAGRLERWSLKTFEREQNVSYAGEMKNMVMGHAATWGVALDDLLLDPTTFKPLPFTYYDDRGSKLPDRRGRVGGFASADGTVYGNWNTHGSPTTNAVFVVEGDAVKRYDEGNLHHAIPGPDGRHVYTAKGVVGRTLQYASEDDKKYGYCLPATSGDYFFSLTSAGGGNKAGGSITVYHRGMKGPLNRLPEADHGLSFDGWDREAWGPWRRIFFIPEANVFAVLPASNDRVVLHKFDVDAALTKSGLDYLFVVSQPPRSAKAGSTFTYPLAVKSKAGGLTYKVDSGPKGMTVSAEGVVTWDVPPDAAADQDVILSVKDKAGQDVFHTFAVKIEK